MSFTREQIEMAMKKLGHAYFENGEHNINIIGIRNSSTGKRVTNAFDDWMTLSYKEKRCLEVSHLGLHRG